MKLQLHFHKVPLALAISSVLTFPVPVFAAPGDPIGGELLINTTATGNQVHPAVARDADGDFVMAWQSYAQDGSRYGI